MSTKYRLRVFVLIALALAGTALAQPPNRQRPQRVDPLTSAIRGRVTTSDTGAPIRGAEVRLAMDGRFNRLVTTNGEGRYEMRNLPAGTYKLTVSKSGFITLEFGQRRPFESAASITVGEGETATGNVSLIRGGAIFGRVLDAHGDPSVGTRVQVMRVRVESGVRRLLAVGAGDLTDDLGAFRVYGLPPGEYYVSASTGLIDAVKRDPPVYYPGTMNLAEAQLITLGAGAEASADFQIVETLRSVTVSGVVLDASGAPAPGAMVNLVSETLSQAPAVQTLVLRDDAAADGTFTIAGVPPGPYTLTASLMRQFDAGVIAATRDRVISQTRGGGPPPPMLMDPPETAAMPLVVGSEGVSGVTLSTRRGGRLNGRFVADTGVTRPLPTGPQALLRSSGPNNMMLTVGGGTGGDFQLVGSGGPARLDVNGVPDGWAVKAVLLDGEDVTDEPFELSGKTGTLRIVMTDRLTTITGSVQSSRDVRDHNILVFPEDATKWTAPSRFVRATRADAEGRFQIRGLPPGERYLVAALDYLEDGEENDRQLLERLRSRATPVTLTDGEQRSILPELIGR